MDRHVLLAALLGLLMAGMSDAQENLGDKKPAAVVELLEDGTAFFIDNLHNHGAADASVVDRSEEAAFSGKASLSVTPFQRFNSQMPDWNFKITKDPELGQYRYIRFAWKRSEAPGIMLQVHSQPNRWNRYFAGTVSDETKGWGAMTRVADAAPRKWEVVTRDLFTDFGPMTINGIGFSALEGPGVAYYDHIYLGRTIEDLDRVTAAKKNVANEPAAEPEPVASGKRWLFLVIVLVVLISLAGFLGFALLVWLRRSKEGDQETPDGPPAKTVGKPTSAKSTGIKTGKSPPKSPEA